MSLGGRTIIGTPAPGTLRTTNEGRVSAPRMTNPRAVGGGGAYKPGDRIHQYELIRELGRGAMGVVYAARDTRLGRRVAIKFLQDAVRDVAERFLIEARATAQCNHENIVVIHEVDEDPTTGTPYMVLEFLEGRSLFDLMDREIPLAPSRAVEIAIPIARALTRAHELGIVHRDLKPDNVFLTESGQVKVLDFGIAKALGSPDMDFDMEGTVNPAAAKRVDLTSHHGIVGTPPYMAPEQLSGEEVDSRCDLYALGIILFEMLAGHHPIQPLALENILESAATDTPLPSLRQVAPHVPEPIANLVDRCLQKSRYDRIATAGELVRVLEGLLPGRRSRSFSDEESPYPGLSAFQESDADRFFGRTREIERVVARLRERPLVGIVGPSGVGKSSFVRAGIGPALKASGERWDVVTFRPGRHPVESLANVATQLMRNTAGNLQNTDHQTLLHRLRTEPGFFAMLLRARARGSDSHLLLFVDQLEELYTLVPDPAERRAFTAALTGVADDPATPLRVIASMRSDFLDRVAEDPYFTEALSRNLVFLAPPDRAGLRDALVEPLEMIGYRFESPAMVDDMLASLGNVSGALPLLQFAAAKLWDARDRIRRVLTMQSYTAIGGVSGALAAHADETLLHMSAHARRITERLFRKLVTPDRTRAIVEVSDIYQLTEDKQEIARVIDDLVNARLLVVQTRGDNAGGTVELVHESLIERWPMLRRWLDEDHEDTAFLAELSTAAKQWDAKGRPAGLLWRGEAMEQAIRWDKQRLRELPARERAFLDAGMALARRSTRMRRFALVGTMVLLVAVATGAMVALVRVRAAEQIANDKAAEAQLAEQKVRAQAAQIQESLDKMKEAERIRLAAEQATVDAQQKSDAAKLAAERARIKEQQAANEVAAKEGEVQKSREELEATNKQLVGALADAKRQEKIANTAKADAEAANAQLKQKLEQERAANKKLQDEMKTLSTKLKGM